MVLTNYIMIPRRVVDEAWENAPEGTTIRDGYRVTRINPATIRKKKRGSTRGTKTTRVPGMLLISPVVALKEYRARPRPIPFSLVAFPQPEHISQFEASAHGLMAGGPPNFNPGAIGTFDINSDPKKTYLHVSEVHDHYDRTTLTDSVRKPYTGAWRRAAFRELLAIAGEAKHNIRLSPEVFSVYLRNGSYGGERKGFRSEVESILRKARIPSFQEGGHLKIKLFSKAPAPHKRPR
jgi:hypothetical protein